jgi:hypothetical protein
VISNGADVIPLDANGSFTFPTPVDDDTTYAVRIEVTPTGPTQACWIEEADGRVVAADVTDVIVRCRDQLRVLFIGNSYTGANGLANVVRTISEDRGLSMTVAQHTPGGATFENHDANTGLATTIAQGWDVVMLQDQSSQGVSSASAAGAPKAAAVSLVQKIRAAGARPMFFMTWAHQHTSNIVWQHIDWVANAAYYRFNAHDLDGEVAPVARTWLAAISEDPTLHPWTADESHPDPDGTYLAATTMFSAITNISPVGASAGGLAITNARRDRAQTLGWAVSRAESPTPGAPTGHWPLDGDAFLRLHPFGGVDPGTVQGPQGPGSEATSFSAGQWMAAHYREEYLDPDAFTLALWARRDWSDPTAATQVIVDRDRGYRMELTGTVLSATAHSVNGAQTVAVDMSAYGDTWHELRLSYDGATVELWVDDVSVGAVSHSGEITYGMDVDGRGRHRAIIFGAQTGDAAATVWATVTGDVVAPTSFVGSLADARLWDRRVPPI